MLVAPCGCNQGVYLTPAHLHALSFLVTCPGHTWHLRLQAGVRWDKEKEAILWGRVMFLISSHQWLSCDNSPLGKHGHIYIQPEGSSLLIGPNKLNGTSMAGSCNDIDHQRFPKISHDSQNYYNINCEITHLEEGTESHLNLGISYLWFGDFRHHYLTDPEEDQNFNRTVTTPFAKLCPSLWARG